MNTACHPTNLFLGHQGFEAWHGDLSANCGTFHVEPPLQSGIEEFRGAVTPVDDEHSLVKGARIISNCRQVHRSQRDIRQDDKDFFFLVMQLDGQATACQPGTQTILHRGDLVLLDVSRPCEFRFEGWSDQVSVILPRKSVLQRFRERQLQINHRIDAASPMGRMSGLLLQQLIGNPGMSEPETRATLEAIITLLRPAIGSAGDHPTSPRADTATLLKARALIDRQLTQENLTPEYLASTLGVSLRNLHRIFSQGDMTVSRYILERRLQHCAEQIKQSDTKIMSIALSSGFKDFSHFSRAFKRHFGSSPSDYRHQPYA